jgi:hypothetical protein
MCKELGTDSRPRNRALVGVGFRYKLTDLYYEWQKLRRHFQARVSPPKHDLGMRQVDTIFALQKCLVWFIVLVMTAVSRRQRRAPPWQCTFCQIH